MTFDLNLPKRVKLAARYICIPKIEPLGPLAAAGEGVTYGRKEGRKARKYIRMYHIYIHCLNFALVQGGHSKMG